MPNNLLITGHPRVGKTTLIQSVVARLEGLKISGFFTEEIVRRGKRAGFAVVTFEGARKAFAHKDIAAEPRLRVGSYGIDPRALDSLALPSLSADPPPDLFVIDEIAKMELLSPSFRNRVEELLDSDHPVLASVALRGTGLIRRVRERRDARLFRVTPKNREALRGQIVREVRAMMSHRK